MSEPVSVPTFAKMKAVSRQAVLDAIKSQRITATRGHDGNYLIDPDKALIEWEANTNHTWRLNAQGGVAKESGPETPDVDGAAAQEQTLAKSRARSEFYKAEKARLEYEELEGALAPIEEIEREWTSIGTRIRTKVMGLPSKLRQKRPELSDDIYFALEALAREALEDLSNGGN